MPFSDVLGHESFDEPMSHVLVTLFTMQDFQKGDELVLFLLEFSSIRLITIL